MDAHQARSLHESRLMRLANVTGVGIGRDEVPQALGSARAGEAPLGQDVIVVFVTHRVPRDRLRDEDVVPEVLEGVPVRVLAIGEVDARHGEA
ncbi:hypothetical protein KY5_1821 [Streptomyces formicae]|uniref:Uncharacterized protein n=1 Tax=Streptomyces formicae TaxID=1616117 RepID=A0A291Q552_9ACTN|nr:hypothetical protein KY5_1821 [Streptomyces formicae]